MKINALISVAVMQTLGWGTDPSHRKSDCVLGSQYVVLDPSRPFLSQWVGRRAWRQLKVFLSLKQELLRLMSMVEVARVSTTFTDKL